MRKLILIPAILLLAAAAFLLLDFRAASSNSHVDTIATSGKSGQDTPPPARMKVYVWVEEKDSLSTRLRDQVIARLRSSGRFDPEALPAARPGPKDYPLLRVWIKRPGLSWTPVYAQTDMEVQAGFSTYKSDIPFASDTSESKPLMLNAPPGVFGMDASTTLTLKDRTIGLVSLPGYWRYLSEQAAGKLVEQLVMQLGG